MIEINNIRKKRIHSSNSRTNPSIFEQISLRRNPSEFYYRTDEIISIQSRNIRNIFTFQRLKHRANSASILIKCNHKVLCSHRYIYEYMCDLITLFDWWIDIHQSVIEKDQFMLKNILPKDSKSRNQRETFIHRSLSYFLPALNENCTRWISPVVINVIPAPCLQKYRQITPSEISRIDARMHRDIWTKLPVRFE